MAPSNATQHSDNDPDENDTSPPTSPSCLLDLCNLPSCATSAERTRRLTTVQSWMNSHPEAMVTMLTSRSCCDKKNGCLPLHWAAGTGFDEMIVILLESGGCSSSSSDAAAADTSCTSNAPVHVDQKAYHPSTDRTALHYAARNGHLSTCRLLIERYSANSHPKCGRGSVTPLQLAVWQNRLDVVKYLVERNALLGRKDVVHERNGFNCGLMHWVGLVPRKRWAGGDTIGDASSRTDDTVDDDGSGVLSLARYLHSLGISYDSSPSNANSQGHTPMHKAARGGNLPLIQYFCHEHGVYDDVQDQAGNYCADIAKMRGNDVVHRWLLEHGSGDRRESYRVLGLEVGTSEVEVRRRYMELARLRHPDKQQRLENDGGFDGNDGSASAAVDEFVKIKEAYEHLSKEGGIGKQKNPKFDEVKLLEDQRRICRDTNDDTQDDDDDDLFMARLLAVLSDYGDDGFPVSLIARRWNQIWPDRPFPSPDEYVIERKAKCISETGEATGKVITKKKVKLLRFLKWKCQGTQVHFRNIEGDVLAFGSCPSTASAIRAGGEK